MTKPSVFIGSSSEGLDFARAIADLLSQDAEVTLWNEEFFRIGDTFIDTLVNSLPRFDFAVLVLTADDLARTRGDTMFGPRDNVIFELGLFMGRLGRERTFMVTPTREIFTDLSGVTMALYEWPRGDGSHLAAIRPGCSSIRKVLREMGVSEAKSSRQIRAVEREQSRQREELAALSLLVRSLLPKFELEILRNLTRERPFRYRMHSGFERELRHLWEIGFIEKTGDFDIKDMPYEGDVKEYFTLTEQGSSYLALRESFASGNDSPP